LLLLGVIAALATPLAASTMLAVKSAMRLFMRTSLCC
jgi:hypothetical protein